MEIDVQINVDGLNNEFKIDLIVWKSCYTYI